jgi:hypothetical protein
VLHSITTQGHQVTKIIGFPATPFCRQVLSQSWELKEVLKAAPKANPATLQRLSQPKHAVVRYPGDSCSYAGWKSLQLSKQRAARERQEREEAQYEAARQEALQGWLRARQKVSNRGMHQEATGFVGVGSRPAVTRAGAASPASQLALHCGGFMLVFCLAVYCSTMYINSRKGA